jgi:hypothetical protein
MASQIVPNIVDVVSILQHFDVIEFFYPSLGIRVRIFNLPYADPPLRSTEIKSKKCQDYYNKTERHQKKGDCSFNCKQT